MTETNAHRDEWTLVLYLTTLAAAALVAVGTWAILYAEKGGSRDGQGWDDHTRAPLGFLLVAIAVLVVLPIVALAYRKRNQ